MPAPLLGSADRPSAARSEPNYAAGGTSALDANPYLSGAQGAATPRPAATELARSQRRVKAQAAPIPHRAIGKDTGAGLPPPQAVTHVHPQRQQPPARHPTCPRSRANSSRATFCSPLVSRET
jgi:hypothetical protein